MTEDLTSRGRILRDVASLVSGGAKLTFEPFALLFHRICVFSQYK